jgi:hypothetical protein
VIGFPESFLKKNILAVIVAGFFKLPDSICEFFDFLLNEALHTFLSESKVLELAHCEFPLFHPILPFTADET